MEILVVIIYAVEYNKLMNKFKDCIKRSCGDRVENNSKLSIIRNSLNYLIQVDHKDCP